MIARHLVIACLIYLTLVLQSSFASDLAFHGFRPWLPGIALVACVLLHDGAASLMWSSLLGLAVDSLSAERLGLNVAIATLVAMGLLITRQEIRSFGVVLTGIFVLIGTIGWRVASATTLGLLNEQTLNTPQLLMSELGSGVYTGVVTICLLSLIRGAKNCVRKRGGSSPTVLTNQWTMLTR
jgi:rod shape-determining protein MreD